ERSTPAERGATQEAPENEVVLDESGASAPVFQWVCGRNSCRLDSNGISLQAFVLRNGQVIESGIRPGLATPAAWGCGVNNGTELFCSNQDGRGRIIQSFIYDGNVVKEVK